MVTLRVRRQHAEALWDLLMEDPGRLLFDGTHEEMARFVAEACGFDHDASLSVIADKARAARSPRGR